RAFLMLTTPKRVKAWHADDPRPLDPDCTCPACANYSRAYLHHVYKAQEIISSMLMTWHNLQYYQELMAGLREAIAGGALDTFVAAFHARREAGDLPLRSEV
ncbi:MAG: tRNA-guanine transglycosylase, partial [Pseudomonadota bacterium]